MRLPGEERLNHEGEDEEYEARSLHARMIRAGATDRCLPTPMSALHRPRSANEQPEDGELGS